MILPEYPYRGKSLELLAGRMHYLDEGSGSPVLMVHGNPTWSYYYRKVVAEISDKRRCIVPDHLGCGFSDKPQDYPYRLQAHIDHLGQLMDHLEIEKVDLLVHDWGGVIGLGWAVCNPERIGRIVILNTAAFPFPSIPLRIAACRWPVLGTFLVRGLNGFVRAARSMTTVRPMPRAVRDAYGSPYDSWQNRVAIDAFVKDIPMEKDHPSRALLEAIEAGLEQLDAHDKAFVWGCRDWCFHMGILQKWKSIWPHARYIELPDTGHYVAEEAPAEVGAALCP